MLAHRHCSGTRDGTLVLGRLRSRASFALTGVVQSSVKSPPVSTLSCSHGARRALRSMVTPGKGGGLTHRIKLKVEHPKAVLLAIVDRPVLPLPILALVKATGFADDDRLARGLLGKAKV